jgi:hypothetical protein
VNVMWHAVSLFGDDIVMINRCVMATCMFFVAVLAVTC